MLQVLYKLKTAKVFDRNRSKEDKGSTDLSDEDPFAIQLMAWCPESRMLCVAGVSANVIIYRFSKLEVTTEVVQVGDRSVSLLVSRLQKKFHARYGLTCTSFNVSGRTQTHTSTLPKFRPVKGAAVAM